MATHSEPIRRAGKVDVQPRLGQRAKEIRPYGTLARYPLGLSDSARTPSVEALNQVLCDTMVLRDLYKKHHWQVSGPTLYSLHLLFDKHFEEQVELVDKLAERVQSLGGVSIAMAHDADNGDDGTNDLVVSDIIRTNEMQVWFLSEHLVDTPLVRADDEGG